MTGSNVPHYFQMTPAGQAEEALLQAEKAAPLAEPAAAEEGEPTQSVQTSYGETIDNLTGFFLGMYRKSNARLAAEDAGTYQAGIKAVGIAGLVVLTSCFGPVRNAAAQTPDPALNEAFSACMQHEGYAGASLSDISGPVVSFSTQDDGAMSFDLASNTLTGTVWAWGKNKTRFQITYADARTESVLPDTSLRQGGNCFRQSVRILTQHGLR